MSLTAWLGVVVNITALVGVLLYGFLRRQGRKSKERMFAQRLTKTTSADDHDDDGDNGDPDGAINALVVTLVATETLFGASGASVEHIGLANTACSSRDVRTGRIFSRQSLSCTVTSKLKARHSQVMRSAAGVYSGMGMCLMCPFIRFPCVTAKARRCRHTRFL